MLEAAEAILSLQFDVVAAVSSGEAAIEAASLLDPDVVVLDISMPGLDGFQTASRITTSGSQARIVFLSNYAGDDFVLEGLTRGASAFVAKSRMALDLVEAIGHAEAGRTFVPTAAVLPRWRRPSGRRHDLQVYRTDAFVVDAWMDFLTCALDAGDSVMSIVSDPQRQALDAQFKARGLDLAALVAAGRYSAVNSSAALEAILRDGMPDEDLFCSLLDRRVERALAASTGSPRHVAIFGGIAPILCARQEFDAALRLERIADAYTASRPVSILCAYPADCLPDDGSGLATRVCAEHTAIVAGD
jgi:CheY-like chemotaxis protein